MRVDHLFSEFNRFSDVVPHDGKSLGIFLQQKAELVRGFIEGHQVYQFPEQEDVVLSELAMKEYDFTSFLEVMSHELKLPLVSEKGSGNVCMIEQNEELRDDFKVVFYPLDVVDYLYALSFSTAFVGLNYNVFLNSDLPRSTAQFWKLIRLGKKIREIHYTSVSKDTTPLQEALTDLIRQVDQVLESPLG